jgi:hypothetical protein
MSDTNVSKVWVLQLQSSGTPDKSYVKCGTSPTLKFPNNQPYTLTAKLFMSDSNGTIMSNLKGSNWDGSGTIMGYALLPMGNSLRAYRSGPPYDCDTGNISLLNQWVHLVVTFDGSTFSIYLNDKLVKSQSGFQPIEAAPANYEFLIGTTYRGSEIGNCFGNVMFYDLAVLSTHTKKNEVKQLKNLSKDSNSPIVALWDFTTKTAKDLSGNGNDGTLVGKAEFVQVDEPYFPD